MSELTKAKADALLARGQMLATVDSIKARLAPRTLAEDAWGGVLDRGTQIAEDAVDLAKARPAATVAVAATAALLLARHPLMNAASSLFSRRDKDDEIAPPPLDGV